MNRNKLFTISIICLCIFLGYVLISFYGPFIYANDIDDLGIADIGNNFFSITFIYFVFYLVKGSYKYGKYLDIFFILFILVCGEILSFFFKVIGTYDFKDKVGLGFSSMLTMALSNRCIKP